MALSVKDRGHVPIVVVGVGFRFQQRVFSRRRSVHVAIGIDRLLRLRIGDGQEITVRVVGKSGRAVNGIGQLRDAVQRIGRIQGLLPQWIGHEEVGLQSEDKGFLRKVCTVYT